MLQLEIMLKQISKKYRTLDEIWVLARRENRLRELAKEIKNVLSKVDNSLSIEEQIKQSLKLLLK